MTDLKSLIAKLEAAKEGSWKFGEAVSLAAGWKHVDGSFGLVLHLEKCSGREEDCNCVWRNPMLSLDAALAVVPEKVVHIRIYIEGVASDLKEGLSEVQLWMDENGDLIHKGYKSTTAHAACIAALKARDHDR